MLDGRRQPSTGGTSRMTRERPVRFCEGLRVKFPGPTRRVVTLGSAHLWVKRPHPASGRGLARARLVSGV
jgi:hypothetical protein